MYVVEKRLAVVFSAILAHVGNNKERCHETNSGTARPLRKCAIRERAGVSYGRDSPGTHLSVFEEMIKSFMALLITFI